MTGTLMQAIDVLRHQMVHEARALHRGQRPVSGVGRRALYTPPTDHTARPITPADPLTTDELLVANRLAVLPAPVGAPVVRDA